MLTRGVLCRMPSSLCKRLRLHEPSIRARASELGYPHPVAHESGQLVIEALEKHQLRLLPLDVVLGALLNGQTELYAGDLDPVEEEAESDPFPEDFQDDDAWLEKRQEEMDSVADLESEEVISALTEAIDRRDGRAHLAMAILLEGDLEDFHQPVSAAGRYWHDREVQGHALEGVEIEWAEGYRARVDARERAGMHLATAADLGQPDALLYMVQLFDDARFFALENPKVHADPMHVASVALQVGRRDVAVTWLECAAEQGDMRAMRELIGEAQSGDPLKCWTWYHLAKLHGKDLTQGDHYAINEDGSPYDDDVGGPMYVDGDDGVDLPPAEEAVKSAGQALAMEIFTRRNPKSLESIQP